MPADDRPVIKVAGAIADGEAVDWSGEVHADQDLARTFASLRVVESIVTAYRSLPSERGGERPPTGTLETTLTGGAAAPGPAGSDPQWMWGPLRILEPLGSGGFGDVYRAYDPVLDREVALKLRRTVGSGGQTADDLFLREARRLARVRHANVLVVHGADRHEGRVGLWTDLLLGETLEESLARRGPLGAQEAVLVGIDLCRALAAVHAAGLVHRDVKTSNVMREQGGRIVLMDFGSVAERVPSPESRSNEESSGTPLYMAPEQLRGDKLFPASDFYALGVVLYRLITGRFPIEASDLAELLERHRRGERVPLRDARPGLPAAVVEAIERALDPDPEARYRSAGAMERALMMSIGVPVPAGEGASVSLTLGRLKVRLAWTAAAVVLVAGSVLVYRTELTPPQPMPREIPPTARPAMPHPSASLTGRATFFRVTPDGREALRPGGRVNPGDDLFVEVEGSLEMYVYILNEDEAGNVFVLYPVPGLQPGNPLPPGTPRRLPGSLADTLVNWEVSSAGGRENILIIASRIPLDGLEKDIVGFPRAEPGTPVRFGRVSPKTLTTLRGIGGIVPDTHSPGPGGHLAALLESLSAGAGREGDLWVSQIQFENPGR